MTLAVEAGQAVKERPLPRIQITDTTQPERIRVVGRGFCGDYRKDQALRLDMGDGKVIVSAEERGGIKFTATYNAKSVVLDVYYPILRTGLFVNPDPKHPFPSCAQFMGEEVRLTGIIFHLGRQFPYFEGISALREDREENILEILLQNNETATIQLDRIRAASLRYANAQRNTFVDVQV